jgi:hypothetical protein
VSNLNPQKDLRHDLKSPSSEAEAVRNVLRLRVQQVSRDITDRCRQAFPDDTGPDLPALTDDGLTPPS